MAHVVHHSPDTYEVAPRVYWLAGLGIALVALLFALTTTTAGNPAALTTTMMEPYVPFIPFVPVL